MSRWFGGFERIQAWRWVALCTMESHEGLFIKVRARWSADMVGWCGLVIPSRKVERQVQTAEIQVQEKE